MFLRPLYRRPVTDKVTAESIIFITWAFYITILENIIEHAFVLCQSGLIERRHLPPELFAASDPSRGELTDTKTLKAMEKLMIFEALHRNNGNRKRAAKDLGIDYSTLYRKIRDFNIETPSTDGRRRIR